MRFDITIDSSSVRDYFVPDEFGDAIIALLESGSKLSRIEPGRSPLVRVKLESCGLKKSVVLKELRAAFGLSLKEAKNLADREPVLLPGLDPASAVRLETLLNGTGAIAHGTSAVDRLGALGRPAQ